MPLGFIDFQMLPYIVRGQDETMIGYNRRPLLDLTGAGDTILLDTTHKYVKASIMIDSEKLK